MTTPTDLYGWLLGLGTLTGGIFGLTVVFRLVMKSHRAGIVDPILARLFCAHPEKAAPAIFANLWVWMAISYFFMSISSLRLTAVTFKALWAEGGQLWGAIIWALFGASVLGLRIAVYEQQRLRRIDNGKTPYTNQGNDA